MVNELRDIVIAATPGPWEPKATNYVANHPSNGYVRSCEDRARVGATWDDIHYIATFDPSLVAALLDVYEVADALDAEGPALDHELYGLRDAVRRVHAEASKRGVRI